MSNLPAKHATAFYATQKKVMDMLRPYRARCVSQYFTKLDAIETFQVFSKEADEDDGNRHKWRGIVTVWYGFGAGDDLDGGKRCAVTFSFDEAMFAKAAGLKCENSWESTAAILASVMPPLLVAA